MEISAAEAASRLLAVGERVLGDGGIVGQISRGEPLEDLTPDADRRLARRIVAVSESLRLLRAGAFHSAPEGDEYPLWPRAAADPVWIPHPRPLLPINRKERYYTGTVLPAIVTADRFINFDLFLTLVGLPEVSVGAGEAQRYVEFLTELNLNESLVTAEDKAQFATAPKAGDTPDLVIAGADWLVVVEAKMYHRPSKLDLVTQFERQQPVVDALREGLGIEPGRVRHGFLLYSTADAPDGLADFVITWGDILEAYRGIGPAYWLDALQRATDGYEVLKSQVTGNAEGQLTGAELVNLHRAGSLQFGWVGRIGGASGKAFAADIASGAWPRVTYQVRSTPIDSKNWMPVAEFLAAVKGLVTPEDGAARA